MQYTIIYSHIIILINKTVYSCQQWAVRADASLLRQRCQLAAGLTKSRLHDHTVRGPRLHADDSCAVVLHDRKQSTCMQLSGAC